MMCNTIKDYVRHIGVIVEVIHMENLRFLVHCFKCITLSDSFEDFRIVFIGSPT